MVSRGKRRHRSRGSASLAKIGRNLNHHPRDLLTIPIFRGPIFGHVTFGAYGGPTRARENKCSEMEVFLCQNDPKCSFLKVGDSTLIRFIVLIYMHPDKREGT